MSERPSMSWRCLAKVNGHPCTRTDFHLGDDDHRAVLATAVMPEERPVGSQLSRIEQAVTAALEGQARLNALVDGLGDRQITTQNWIKLTKEEMAVAMSELHDDTQFFIGYTRAMNETLAAIEAKLESGAKFDVAALNEIKRYIAVTCRRSASKKPSPKGRR